MCFISSLLSSETFCKLISIVVPGIIDESMINFQDVEELMGLAPEKVFLKWMNFHPKKAGYEKNKLKVCSNCRLRSSCESGYLLTNKADEARTIDLMRVLLAYGFDSINGSVANTSKYLFFYSMLIYLYT